MTVCRWLLSLCFTVALFGQGAPGNQIGSGVASTISGPPTYAQAGGTGSPNGQPCISGYNVVQYTASGQTQIYSCGATTAGQYGIAPAGAATSCSSCGVGSANSQSSATGTVSVLNSNAGVCVENFLGADTIHGGTDYGAAISAAVQSQPLTTQSKVSICIPGDHPIFTQAVFDRPISFWGYNARLVPQSSLASTPVIDSACTVTVASQAITCSSTANLVTGMAVGGIGIPATAYIQTIPNSTTFTISLVPALQFNGIMNGSTTLSGLSSMRGLATGQTIIGYGIPVGTTISAVNYATNSLTLSQAATVTSGTPSAFSIGGSSTWTTNIKAVSITPVVSWIHNNSALQNAEGVNIQGESHGLWIYDTSNRGLTGVQGMQVWGWDQFKNYDYRVDFLAGSCLVLGGPVFPSTTNYVNVRESNFFNNQCRMSGEGTTGQSVFELMTGVNNATLSADEIYGLDFSNGSAVFNYAEAVTIGTYNPAHFNNTGIQPRLIYFQGDFHLEGGNEITNTLQNLAAPYDQIHCFSCDVYLNQVELAVPGYGKSLMRLDQSSTASLQQTDIHNSAKTVSYVVSVANGSPTVTWNSGGNGGFDLPSTGFWDGVAVQITDSGACSAGCNFLNSMQNSVAAGGATLTLASNYTGSTGSATLVIGFGGYFFNAPNPNSLTRIDIGCSNKFTTPSAATLAILGLGSSTASFEVGQGFNAATTSLPSGSNCFSGFSQTSTGSIGVNGASPNSSYAINADGDINSTGVYRVNGTGILQSISNSTSLRASAGLYGIVNLVNVWASDTSGNFCIGSNLPPSCTSDPFVVSSTGSIKKIASMQSGSSSNTDLIGELTFSSATTAAYTFTGTYASHPECWVQAQGSTATSGAPYPTYTGTTSFTINFPAAFTGNVSYGCVGRN